MSDIANYQRNANQKYNEAPPHICQNGNHSKVYSSKCLGECGEKEPSHIVDGNVHWCNHYGKNMEAPLKTKNRVAVWFCNPTPEHVSGENYNVKTHACLCLLLHYLQKQDMETT